MQSLIGWLVHAERTSAEHPDNERGRERARALWQVFWIGLIIRVIVTVVLDRYLVAKTGGGWLFLDDHGYDQIGQQLALFWQGRAGAISPGDQYLVTNYIYLVALVYYLVGPHLLVVKLLNAMMGAVCAVVTALVARRYFGERTAWLTGLAVAVWPSLVLWSALNLKDTASLLLALIALLGADRFRTRPSVGMAASMLVSLALLEDLRSYLFLGLAVLIAVILITHVAIIRRRVPAYIGLVAVLGVFTSLSSYGPFGFDYLRPGLLANMEVVRSSMALGANSALIPDARQRVQQDETVKVVPGRAYQVDAQGKLKPFASAGAANEATALDPAKPVVIEAGPGSAGRGAGSVTVLRPGQVVVVATPPKTPAAGKSNAGRVAESQPGTMRATDDGKVSAAPSAENSASSAAPPVAVPVTVVSTTLVLDESGAGRRTLAYLPVGFVFAWLAPFPWVAHSATQALAGMEMLIWYCVLPFALLGLWRARAGWYQLLLPVGYVAGLILLFALVQGNGGTLFRHRSLVIPIVLMFAAAGGLDVFERSRQRWTARACLAPSEFARPRTQ